MGGASRGGGHHAGILKRLVLGRLAGSAPVLSTVIRYASYAPYSSAHSPNEINPVDAPSSGRPIGSFAALQVRHEFLFCIEHTPLNGPDRNGFVRGDLMVFPLLDKAQC